MATRSRTTKKSTAAPAAVESGADILARIRPQRRVESTQVCLNPKLIKDFADADAELHGMLDQVGHNSNRLHPGVRSADAVDAAEQSPEPALRAQARKVRKIEQEIVASQVTFTFTSLNPTEYADLTAEHPPRKEDRLDQYVGYDREQVINALVRASLTSPTFEDCVDDDGHPRTDCDHEDCGTWQQLVSIINPAEWNNLRDTANAANSGVSDAPKSPLASRILDQRGSASQ